MIAEAPSQPGPWIQFREANGFEYNRLRIPIPSLAPELEGLRIVHLSDLHMGPSWSLAYDRLIACVRDNPPDLLLITGDYVENKRDHRPAVPFVRRLLKGLTARLGCFGILGNHDRYHFAPRLRGTPVKLLDGKRQVIEQNGAAIELIGLPGVDRADLTSELLESFPEREPQTLRVVLSHYPDHIRRTESLRPDLFLAGHTHGGQICPPGGLPLLRHDSLPRHLCRGAHRLGRTWLVVNRGLGFSGLPVRIFCPSEVIELTLTRAATGQHQIE